MGDGIGPYLFDIGVIALGHTAAPLQDARIGDIDAVVPYPAVFGVHTVLTTYYGRSNADASRLFANFLDAQRIRWVDRMREDVVRGGFQQAATANVGGWDGYYAQVTIEEGVETILTIDDDFERFDDFATEVVLPPDEFATLNRNLNSGGSVFFTQLLSPVWEAAGSDEVHSISWTAAGG